MTGLAAPDRFVPAPELADWIRSAYVDESGPLYAPEHEHLADAEIGCVWTNCENRRNMRRIVGQAELVKNIGVRQSVWQRARAAAQIMDWFGCTPDFLLTFDAIYADQAEDAVFCALVDHELCHCAQALDEHGMPAFEKHSGLPKYAIRGHDVEEFTSVVRRFGIEAAGEQAVDFVLAAAQKPQIGRAQLTRACGTCLRLAA